MSSTTISDQSSQAQNYYRTNKKRRGVLGHASLGVTSIAISEKFYTAVLAPFGVSLIYFNDTRTTIGYGPSSDEEPLTLFERGAEARAPGAGTHLAFNAPTRKAVRDFWEAGIAHGGKSEGEPGIRFEQYYAAFLLDPDGYKIEAVFQDDVENAADA